MDWLMIECTSMYVDIGSGIVTRGDCVKWTMATLDADIVKYVLLCVESRANASPQHFTQDRYTQVCFLGGM